MPPSTFSGWCLTYIGKEGRESALLVEGLKTLGPDRVTEVTIKKLQMTIPDELKPMILKDTRTAVAWVKDVILKICKGSA